MLELRKKARERVKAKCKVCPVCNGLACAGDVPGMGGIGTGASFQNNIKSLATWRLVPRFLHNADEPDPGIELWGEQLGLPVMAGPVGSIAVNLGSDMRDEDFTRFVLHGCRTANTLAGLGDVPDTAEFGRRMKIVRESGEDAGRRTVPFIKPWGAEAVRIRLNMAAEAGARICGMDVDAVGLTALRRMGAPVGGKTPGELADIIRLAHENGMKFIVKGIMATDEAVLAADAGADAVLVSNHGGRVLDHSPGAAEVLPEIADAVGGRAVVMMDGGIRNGVDVLKALALGAKAVFICRPVLVIAHGDEENGIAAYFAQIRDELVQAMRLTGCVEACAAGRHMVR